MNEFIWSMSMNMLCIRYTIGHFNLTSIKVAQTLTAYHITHANACARCQRKIIKQKNSGNAQTDSFSINAGVMIHLKTHFSDSR